ncbi:hypothetical protein MAPG_10125 [Magnaporthiopsis poae ATCC 64411]|uniref:Uncharacterized protein n=1 Tax=Magnaporthiopsis poae (strain ATCC 64411 / 73-15) TaxID=644358 RepID=A0A0C4EBS0_MAGP6|nr:hypothetical protein MAPG_10125 [Magnaporthiopsis poae ATCC 64411]
MTPAMSATAVEIRIRADNMCAGISTPINSTAMTGTFGFQLALVAVLVPPREGSLAPRSCSLCGRATDEVLEMTYFRLEVTREGDMRCRATTAPKSPELAPVSPRAVSSTA